MWPKSHLIMFFGMFLIHIIIMPWVMIARAKDFMISLNQIYMGIIMATLMVLLESTMHPMPCIGTIVCFFILILSICAVRNQWFIKDKEFLKDMIPHHSMALLTSGIAKNKANNNDVKQLATIIEDNQTKEIDLMNNYLKL